MTVAVFDRFILMAEKYHIFCIAKLYSNIFNNLIASCKEFFSFQINFTQFYIKYIFNKGKVRFNNTTLNANFYILLNDSVK
jgi:hypothetical protein